MKQAEVPTLFSAYFPNLIKHKSDGSDIIHGQIYLQN
jgi:hypothetical protein